MDNIIFVIFFLFQTIAGSKGQGLKIIDVMNFLEMVTAVAFTVYFYNRTINYQNT